MDLPRLPGQYLAEVYAAIKLGQPEEGFHFAPGILYMASQVGGGAQGRRAREGFIEQEYKATAPPQDP